MCVCYTAALRRHDSTTLALRSWQIDFTVVAWAGESLQAGETREAFQGGNLLAAL